MILSVENVKLMPSKKIIFILFLANLILRSSTLSQLVVEIAEPQWAQFALNMIKGDAPYTTMIGEKPFFLYLYYYAILSIFGWFNLYAVHFVTILWVTCTAIVIFIILRNFVSEREAVSGALIFSIVTTLGEFKLISSDGETLMNLPICISALLFVMNINRKKLIYSFLVGIFIGLGGQFRYQAGIQLVAVFSYLFIFGPLLEKEKIFEMKILTKRFLYFSMILLGYSVVYGLVFFVLWRVESWDSYKFWSLKYSLGYIDSGLKTINVFEKGFVRTLIMILFAFVVWFSATKTVIENTKDIRRNNVSARTKVFIFSLLWLVFGFIAVSAGGRFYSRYYTQIFPPLAILASLGMPSEWINLRKKYSWKIEWKKWALIIPAVILLILRWFSPWIHEKIGELDYAPFQKKIGQYIKERTSNDDMVYIWGWGNSIYFYANRFPATRFITSDFLTGRIPGSPTAYDLNFDTSFNIIPGSWEMFIDDLERDKPIYILDTSPANIHDYGKYPMSAFPILNNYIKEKYEFETSLHDVVLYRKKAAIF